MGRPYPVFLKLEGRPALVVGGGPVAARKSGTLIACGAEVTAVAPESCSDMEALASDGSVDLQRREFVPEDVHGRLAIVIAATDDPGLNAEIARIALSHGVHANSADPPDAGDVTLPSIVTEGPLTVAISTSGISPALARKLRRDITGFLGEGYGPFLEFMSHARERLKTAAGSQAARADALNSLIESDLIERFREDPEAARTEADGMLDALLTKYAG